jgi:hypothetical protein
MVCCFTDGISESRNADGELLGCDGLLQIMNSIESTPDQLMARMGKLLVTGSGPMPWPDLHPANVGGFFFSKMNRLWRAKK